MNRIPGRPDTESIQTAIIDDGSARPADTSTHKAVLTPGADPKLAQSWTLTPISPEELATLALHADRVAVRQAVRAAVDDLQAEKVRAQEVIDSATATADAKKLARAVKRVADAAIDIAKLVKDIA